MNETPWLEPYYNIANFPIFVAHHGNWDIYRNRRGYCAALPVVKGCKASHFGDYEYTRCTLRLEGINLPPLSNAQEAEAK